MGRQATVKNIRESFSCYCGYNDCTPIQEKISHASLRSVGAKRKVDKKTKVVFYLFVINAHSCENCDNSNF